MRTGRNVIRIGRSAENELVLTDHSVAALHVTLSTNGVEFTAQTSDPNLQMIVDRQWKHPKTRIAGAFILIGASELFVYPGELEDQLIQEQIRARKQLSPAHGSAPLDASDHTAIAQMTDDDAAYIVEEEERTMLFDPAMENLEPGIVEEPSSNQTMIMDDHSTALHAIPEHLMPKHPSAPLVEAEAMQERSAPSILAGSQQSVMAAVPNAIDITPVQKNSFEPEPKFELEPETISPHRAMVVRSKEAAPTPPKPKKSNAWGDSASRPRIKSSASAPPKPRKSNAWGDPIKKIAKQPQANSKNNAWGENQNQRPLTRTEDSKDEQETKGLICLNTLLEQSGDAGIQVLTEPDGEYANSIRLLSTRLNDLINSHGHRTFMISSALPLTGKTTTALNLALVLAEDPQRKVALIETDFRNPRLADILCLKNQAGLLDIVSKNLNPAEVLHRIEHRNLIVFTSGGRHKTPASLLAAPQLKTLLRELAASVDIAIVDAPSVLPHADANLLAPQVDTSLLVSLDGFSQSGVLDKVLKQLGRERVCGSIYNKIDRSTEKRLNEMRNIRLTLT